jgi:hypothetical protein
MRAAANFLVANYGRQKIITMPQSVPKIAIFEEAARTLEIPGGVRMIQEYYRQMRKFGCNILAVVQQLVIWVAFWLCVAMVLVYSKAQTSIQYPSTILKFVVEWPQH